ncbi:MAG: MFS transporter [Proteobacteria bacterium]|nr:MFS transporter [Pseudomonadota bacterium]
MKQRNRYENTLVAIFGLAIGSMSFEQLGISYLIPFIQPALQLSNTQVGLLMSVYWVAFALSSYATGSVLDGLRRRKPLLVLTLVSFSLGSLWSAGAASFGALVAARAFMGLLEGSLFTAVQSFVALASTPERRGSNLGIVAGVCPNILGILIAPMVLVQMSLHFGWRVGCAAVLVPGMMTALLVATVIHEPAAMQAPSAPSTVKRGRLIELLRLRNVWICAGLCCFYVAYLNAGFTFLPLYYINVRHFPSQQMSALMGVLGISAVLFAFLLPVASDRLGRRSVLMASGCLSVVGPLAALLISGPIALLACLVLIGCAISGTASLITSTIPAETVPPQHLATAIGLIIAVGVIIGGLVGPGIAGWVADTRGLGGPLLLPQFNLANLPRHGSCTSPTVWYRRGWALLP